MSENMSPLYSKGQMEDSRLKSDDDSYHYLQILEDGGPDIAVVPGAYNNYEMRTRYKGAESDILHNLNEGNLPEVVILPLEEQKINEDNMDYLKDKGVEFLASDYELNTTVDDFKTPRDITGSDDRVHIHTSDYHALKVDLIGSEILEVRELDTFGFRTDLSKRENLLKHNFMAQTAHGLWKKYNL